MKTFRKVLRNNKLSVPQKQSILCTLAKVECMKARLEVMAIRKSVAGVQVIKKKKQTITDRVCWIDKDNAFENRMRTVVIANLTHIDVLTFL
ncbi:hypothetical protein TSAR_012056 [Trichomalopsis sarcophagae]|uniref:Uncharacterized protein n=1 Tax=Trichomalopsis sarcophagae TaxID=543379 RepID=A0A232EEP8_9HYME|nr:hypothetical protein TSAR_012056 [Trichomalopsis sarcophagae]